MGGQLRLVDGVCISRLVLKPGREASKMGTSTNRPTNRPMSRC